MFEGIKLDYLLLGDGFPVSWIENCSDKSLKSKSQLTFISKEAPLIKETIAPSVIIKVKITIDYVGREERRLSDTSQV